MQSITGKKRRWKKKVSERRTAMKEAWSLKDLVITKIAGYNIQ